MTSKWMASVATIALLAPMGAARAQSADIPALQAQTEALKAQNIELEQRLSRLEAQQQVAPAQTPAAQTPASPTDFMGMVTKGPLSVVTDGGPICWQGVCIFGTVDAGLGWVSHGLPENGQNYEGESLINKWTKSPYFGIAQNGLSQTTLGIKGEHEFLPGWSGVFMASSGINPQSGQLANMPGTIISNNGLNRNSYSFSGDGGRGGQPFNDELYVGASSQTFGELTVGRHRPLSQELMLKYDPAGGGYNYSPIGYNGQLVQGLGATEDARWDDSLKYRVAYGPARFGAMYKFVDGSGGTNTATGNLCTAAGAPNVNCQGGSTLTTTQYYTPHNDAAQIDLGGSYGGFDIDGVLGYFHQATAILGGNSPLSMAQLAGADTFTSNTGKVTNSYGGNNANTLQAYTADNTAGAIGAKYTWEQWKFFAGWAHVISHNPVDNVGIGAPNDQGGYILSTVNNGFFAHARLLDTEWTGVKYAYDPKTDITLAYYHVGQNTYGNATQDATCSAKLQNARAAQCSGTLDAASLYVDYHFTKHFDVYGGLEVSNVEGGLSNGYNYYTNWAPSAGARFTF